MTEAMEILVKVYLEFVRGYFVRSDVKYKYNKGHSGIDLIGIDNKCVGIVVEVKDENDWTSFNKAKKYIDGYFADTVTVRAVKEFLGNIEYKGMLVLLWMNSNAEVTRQIKEYGKQRSPEVEVIGIDEIIAELYKKADSSTHYDDPILQLIKNLKQYVDWNKAEFLHSKTPEIRRMS